jgi:hypothetical protein
MLASRRTRARTRNTLLWSRLQKSALTSKKQTSNMSPEQADAGKAIPPDLLSFDSPLGVRETDFIKRVDHDASILVTSASMALMSKSTSTNVLLARIEPCSAKVEPELPWPILNTAGQMVEQFTSGNVKVEDLAAKQSPLKLQAISNGYFGRTSSKIWSSLHRDLRPQLILSILFSFSYFFICNTSRNEEVLTSLNYTTYHILTLQHYTLATNESSYCAAGFSIAILNILIVMDDTCCNGHFHRS